MLVISKGIIAINVIKKIIDNQLDTSIYRGLVLLYKRKIKYYSFIIPYIF